jgi:hypothetical protein
MSDVENASSEDEAPMETSPVLKSEGDICGDGSIMKEILTPGSGWQKPPKVQF